MESAPGTLIFINEYMHMLDSSVWANERDTIRFTLRETQKRRLNEREEERDLLQRKQTAQSLIR